MGVGDQFRHWKAKHWNEHFADYDPTSPLVLINHSTSPPLRATWECVRAFWRRHWQWIIGTTIAVSLGMARRTGWGRSTRAEDLRVRAI